MTRSRGEARAAERSRLLAELAEIIGQAQRLSRRLRASAMPRATRIEAEDLFRQLEALRTEVDALRRGPWVPRPEEIDRTWTKIIPWNRRSPG